MTADEAARLKQLIDSMVTGVQAAPIPAPTPVPPVSGPQPPPRVGHIIGPELVGKGNPSLQSTIPGNCVVSYRYIVQVGDSVLEFRCGGQAQNGTPPDTWAWVSQSPGGPSMTPYEHVSGQNVAVVTVTAGAVGRELWINEQPSEICNRYAQVNAGPVTSTRGR